MKAATVTAVRGECSALRGLSQSFSRVLAEDSTTSLKGRMHIRKAKPTARCNRRELPDSRCSGFEKNKLGVSEEEVEGPLLLLLRVS